MNFSSIKTRTILSDTELTFNLYLRVAGKYLLYVHNGESLSKDRFKKLKSNNVKELFIAQEEEKLYQNYLDYLLVISEDSSHSSEKRAEALNKHSTQSVENFNDDPQSQISFKMLEKAALGLVSGLGKKTDVLREFYKAVFDSDADLITRHAVGTSSLVACFAEALKFDHTTQNNLVLASMMMDVGIQKIPPDFRSNIYSKQDLKKIPKEFADLFHQHPQASVEILSDKDYINKEVLTYVLTHEERKSGDGFPNHIKNLSREQQILGLCHTYAGLTNCLKMSYKDAFKHLQIDLLGNFDLDILNLFKDLLKNQGMEM